MIEEICEQVNLLLFNGGAIILPQSTCITAVGYGPEAYVADVTLLQVQQVIFEPRYLCLLGTNLSNKVTIRRNGRWEINRPGGLVVSECIGMDIDVAPILKALGYGDATAIVTPVRTTHKVKILTWEL